MKLQNRKLSMKMRGDDVKRLHNDLFKLGYTIPQPEKTKQLFGSGTRKAVQGFQIKQSLKASGVVDKQTADLLAAVIDKSKEQPVASSKPDLFVVRGQVRSVYGELLPGIQVRAFDVDLKTEKLFGQFMSD